MSRYYRDSESDDDRYKRTTVTRYKVGPDRHGERFERTERIQVDDDRRSKFSARTSGDLLDARAPLSPDRPRSAFEPYNGDRSRTVYYERDVERDNHHRDPDRSRITVFESKEADRDWDRRSHRGHNEDELKIEKRVEERFDDTHGHDVERYRKETEYYVPQSPPPPPVIIRQQSTEPQKIIVQDPPPAPIVVPRQQNPGVVVLRDREEREMVRKDRDSYEDDYYYRHERRDVGPYRGDYYRNDRERDYAMARYGRRRRDDGYDSDDDEFYYRRTVRRDRSESPHHKRHLAEGALAGAGISALLTSRRDEYGDLPDNRGRKVLAGAALGALGTEVARRAHSAYEDRFGDRPESPDHHHLLKKGLGVAAVALAAAGAAKYYQASKVDKEEAHRGRSRTRGGYYSADDYSRSVSRASRRSKSRRRSISTAAKAAIGTAATAGIIKHFRDKSKSKSRSRHGSRSRSKSRLRRVAEIGGVAAAAGVASKLWANHKENKEHARNSSASSDDEYYRRRDSRSRHRSLSGSRHRSRSRSMARSPYSQPGADPELGLVEYGNDPLYPESRDELARRRGESDAEDGRGERRRRRRRDRSVSAFGSDDEHERKRSRSRVRDAAAAGAAAGAAAMGIKEFKDRKDRKEQDKRHRRSREREDHGRPRDEDQRRDYFDDRARPRSPPTASGGAYYPPYPPTPGDPPMASNGNHAPYPDHIGGAPPQREYQPYVPQDYTGYAPPPPPPPAGPPPPPEPGFRGAGHPPGPAPPPAGPPPTGGRYPPDHMV
ncbi:uncharacterized protein MAM_07248 [Metarhizium album ARSEF 1941]|uniref:DUF3824 domain-containing protein n=1 Tax=Metarhizium album (strain ARSEF 1941) TaxID=1081103 RepID=A0A0B2WMD8_METAS|nr:uncharacterized protein MAM_07248 [Metarhizium album ARSEF 1941]KHN94829.1 hypothetical protein MAM_07248 [Metarhizium album ARSEF 1941]